MLKQRLKSWEAAGLMALCICLLAGLWAMGEQRGLADGLVRLHVIARSDAEADQAEKLAVRDEVLALLSPALADCGTLRIILGPGQGHNWWCVIFLPLCTEALAEPAADAFRMLPEDQTRLVTRDGAGYVLRFRLLELWDALAGKFG